MGKQDDLVVVFPSGPASGHDFAQIGVYVLVPQVIVGKKRVFDDEMDVGGSVAQHPLVRPAGHLRIQVVEGVQARHEAPLGQPLGLDQRFAGGGDQQNDVRLLHRLPGIFAGHHPGAISEPLLNLPDPIRVQIAQPELLQAGEVVQEAADARLALLPAANDGQGFGVFPGQVAGRGHRVSPRRAHGGDGGGVHYSIGNAGLPVVENQQVPPGGGNAWLLILIHADPLDPRHTDILAVGRHGQQHVGLGVVSPQGVFGRVDDLPIAQGAEAVHHGVHHLHRGDELLHLFLDDQADIHRLGHLTRLLSAQRCYFSSPVSR